MPLVDHLAELRTRAAVCLIAALAGMLLSYALYDPWIANLLRGPLDALSGRTDNPFAVETPLLRLLRPSGGAIHPKLDLHFIGPIEVFMTKLKASFFAGLVLMSPLLFHQIWAFVSVGLRPGERRGAFLLAPASLALFLCGVAIAYLLMLPVVLYFLVIVSGRGLVPTLILSKYVSLVVVCCLAFGVIFEMPLVILFLARLGIVSPAMLRRNRKYAVVGTFIVAAVLTPPDVVTQVLMALPMLVLYEASVWLAKLAWRRDRSPAGP